MPAHQPRQAHELGRRGGGQRQRQQPDVPQPLPQVAGDDVRHRHRLEPGGAQAAVGVGEEEEQPVERVERLRGDEGVAGARRARREGGEGDPRHELHRREGVAGREGAGEPEKQPERLARPAHPEHDVRIGLPREPQCAEEPGITASNHEDPCLHALETRQPRAL